MSEECGPVTQIGPKRAQIGWAVAEHDCRGVRPLLESQGLERSPALGRIDVQRTQSPHEGVVQPTRPRIGRDGPQGTLGGDGGTTKVTRLGRSGPRGAVIEEVATEPATGLHGTSIETVTISGTTLNADDVTEVTTDADNQNSIVVAVKNGGDFQETQVQVQAFVDSEQVGDTGTIAVFDAGTTANVSFKFEPLFNKAKQSVKIVVKPVAGEENTANNSRTYSVIFKFPG